MTYHLTNFLKYRDVHWALQSIWPWSKQAQVRGGLTADCRNIQATGPHIGENLTLRQGPKS